jgi:hypothetical protein
LELIRSSSQVLIKGRGLESECRTLELWHGVAAGQLKVAPMHLPVSRPTKSHSSHFPLSPHQFHSKPLPHDPEQLDSLPFDYCPQLPTAPFRCPSCSPNIRCIVAAIQENLTLALARVCRSAPRVLVGSKTTWDKSSNW